MWRRKKWLKSFIVVVITIVFLEWKFSLKVLSGVLKYRNGRCFVVVNDAFYELLAGNLCKFPDYF